MRGCCGEPPQCHSSGSGRRSGITSTSEGWAEGEGLPDWEQRARRDGRSRNRSDFGNVRVGKVSGHSRRPGDQCRILAQGGCSCVAYKPACGLTYGLPSGRIWKNWWFVTQRIAQAKAPDGLGAPSGSAKITMLIPDCETTGGLMYPHFRATVASSATCALEPTNETDGGKGFVRGSAKAISSANISIRASPQLPVQKHRYFAREARRRQVGCAYSAIFAASQKCPLLGVFAMPAIPEIRSIFGKRGVSVAPPYEIIIQHLVRY